MKKLNKTQTELLNRAAKNGYRPSQLSCSPDFKPRRWNALQALKAEGLVALDGDRYVATEKGREALAC